FLRNIHNTDFFFALTYAPILFPMCMCCSLLIWFSRGLLLTYSTMRNLERNKGRFNYFSFSINMYLRFYPAVFGTILLFYLLPLAGDGPFWQLLDRFHVDACRKTLMESMLTYNFCLLDMESFYHSSMVSEWYFEAPRPNNSFQSVMSLRGGSIHA